MSDRDVPALFVSHGSPMIAVESDGFTAAIARLGRTLRPKAAIVVSAHGQTGGPWRATSSEHPSTVHDFGGFPEELYRIRYPAPGSPELAKGIASTLAAAGLASALDDRRGLDHGAWVPLRLLFPEANVPVVELLSPRDAAPMDFMAAGKALAELRRRDVLLLGTGGIVHNLGEVRFGSKEAPVDAWAKEFDDWVRSRLDERDDAALLDYRSNAPYADRAVPTSEHFDPVFFVLGAARPGDRVAQAYEGFHYGNLSMRSFMLSPR